MKCIAKKSISIQNINFINLVLMLKLVNSKNEILKIFFTITDL